MLLCGPISQEFYEDTFNDYFEFGQQKSKAQRQILVDRFGLQATRCQVEALMDDVLQRDEYIEILLNEYQNLKLLYDVTLANNNGSSKTLLMTETINEEEVAFLRQEIVLKDDKIEMLEYELEKYAAEKKLELNQFIKSKVPFSRLALYDKVTSIARGFLARRRVKHIRQLKLADQTGILVAMNPTKQGNYTAHFMSYALLRMRDLLTD